MEPRHLAACAAIAATAPDPWRTEDFESHLAANHPAWVALDGGEVAAFTCFRPGGDGSADLALLAVAPARRNRGIGAALLRHSLAQLVRQGVQRCLLEVRASNAAALAVYACLGFSVLARRPGLYSHPREDGLLLELVLPAQTQGAP